LAHATGAGQGDQSPGADLLDHVVHEQVASDEARSEPAWLHAPACQAALQGPLLRVTLSSEAKGAQRWSSCRRIRSGRLGSPWGSYRRSLRRSTMRSWTA